MKGRTFESLFPGAAAVAAAAAAAVQQCALELQEEGLECLLRRIVLPSHVLPTFLKHLIVFISDEVVLVLTKSLDSRLAPTKVTLHNLFGSKSGQRNYIQA